VLQRSSKHSEIIGQADGCAARFQITGYRPLQSATLVLAAPVLVRRL